MRSPLTTEDSEGQVGRRAFAQDYSEPEGLLEVEFAFEEKRLLGDSVNRGNPLPWVGRRSLL
jgi:hypothetical protein